MVHVALTATDDDLLLLVRSWLDVLAVEDYERVFNEIGYAMAYGREAQGIRRDIKNYRSLEFYPGISDFRVSDWRTAEGGNPKRAILIRRYEYMESLPIVMTIELDLPLNGRWSDLQISFVVSLPTPHDSEGVLWLEDIACPRQFQESADA